MSIQTALIVLPIAIGIIYAIVKAIARKTKTRVDDEIAKTLSDILKISRGGDIDEKLN